MKHLPVFRGKYPIHFTVFVGPDGEPDFKVIHTENRLKAMKHGWCHICGTPLDHVSCFIGGEKCAQYRLFIDGPMHEECAMYSAKVCPYLANADHGHSKAPPKHADAEGVEVKVHSSVESGRPARMAMFWTLGFSIMDVAGLGLCFKSFPFTKIDWSIMPERKVQS